MYSCSHPLHFTMETKIKELETQLKEASFLIHDARAEMERGPIIKDNFQQFFNVLKRLREVQILFQFEQVLICQTIAF